MSDGLFLRGISEGAWAGEDAVPRSISSQARQALVNKLDAVLTRGGFEVDRTDATARQNWQELEAFCSDLLASRGKSFELMIYVAAARAVLRGPAGLASVLSELAVVVDKHWDQIYPPLADEAEDGGRSDAIDWLSNFLTVYTYPLTDGQPAPQELRPMVLPLREFAAALYRANERTKVTTNWIGKIEGLAQTLQANLHTAPVREEPPPPDPRGSHPAPAPAAAPPAPKQDNPTQPTPTVVAPAPVVIAAPAIEIPAVLDVRRIRPIFRQLVDTMLPALEDVDDPRPIRLARSFVWDEIVAAPDAKNGQTDLREPATAAVARAKSLLRLELTGAAAMDALTFSEETTYEAPFWFDPQVIARRALSGLRHSQAAAALDGEVALLLARIGTTWLGHTFAGGRVPLAGPEARAWASKLARAGGAGAAAGAPTASGAPAIAGPAESGLLEIDQALDAGNTDKAIELAAAALDAPVRAGHRYALVLRIGLAAKDAGNETASWAILSALVDELIARSAADVLPEILARASAALLEIEGTAPNVAGADSSATRTARARHIIAANPAGLAALARRR